MSVRLSVTRRYSVETAKHTVKLFSPTGTPRPNSVETAKHTVKLFSPTGRYTQAHQGVAGANAPGPWGSKGARRHTILVFSIPNVMQYFDGGVECKGVEKIAIFDQYLALSQTRYKIRPQLLWNANRKPYQSFRILPVSMTLLSGS